MLLEEGRQLVLRMDDGGVWRVEAGRWAWKLAGRRVSIVGTRDGFNLVAVDRPVLAERGTPGP
ncbi:DUF5818 domain-containing protein [Sphingomonas sp. M1-B02]|uniref:DUF5818 domain-containing protein n=1 Tax=Sphingomonas sp. M1-B02 TaxID=3114300 RepID=UPI00223F22FD|nr:DUF5818 domain-containing protein [Sphingomonas sp. S6-11]UZK67848.1 DUF5818 domain-containing protein [Sphingomonas sp. S6-11]